MEKIVCGLTDLKDIGRTLRPGIPPNNIVQSKQSEAIVDQKLVQALPKPMPTVTKKLTFIIESQI